MTAARTTPPPAARPCPHCEGTGVDTSSTPLVDVILPVATVSELNHREHEQQRSARRTAREGETLTHLVAKVGRDAGRRLPKPVVVRLTRLGGGRLDDGNLGAAFKAVQDGVAAWLGVDDGDRSKVPSWTYDQRPGQLLPAVRVQIWAAPESAVEAKRAMPSRKVEKAALQGIVPERVRGRRRQRGPSKLRATWALTLSCGHVAASVKVLRPGESPVAPKTSKCGLCEADTSRKQTRTRRRA